MRALPILSALSLLSLAGCIDSELIANQMVKTGTLQDMNKAFFKEESSAHAGAAAPGLLMLMDGFIVASPKNAALLTEAATLNCGYALAFLDFSDTAWGASLYRKGRDYTRRAAAEELPALAAAIDANDLDGIRVAAEEVDEDNLDIIFWMGMCWGSRINATKAIDEIADLPIVDILMQRALEIDESYYFAVGHLLFGMMYGGRTKAVGGDPARGRRHYERAVELTGGRFLMAKVHYAVNYAVMVQDHALYLRLLGEVLDSCPDEVDDDQNRLTNQVARDIAKKLMGELPTRFPDYKPGDDEDEDEDDEPMEDLDLD